MNVNDKSFATSEERQAVAFWFLNSLRAEEGDSLGTFKFRIGEAISMCNISVAEFEFGFSAIGPDDSVSVPRCLNKSLLAQVFPLHDAHDLKNLRSQWVKKFFSPQPLGNIRP